MRNSRRLPLLWATAAAVMFAACTDPPPAEPEAAEPAVPPTETPDPTVGGDGSGIEVAPLSAEDIEAAGLAGELACSFVADSGGTLLLARGDVASDEPSHGVVRVGDDVEAISAPGGFDAMLPGTDFSGADATITIALTGPATGGGESPPRPATLTYDRADGAPRDYPGQWQCGP